MSVFLKNTCPFNNCRNNFKSLSDLIIHIENYHLDFDPMYVQKLEEEKPDSISLSYVLKFGDCRSEISPKNEAVIKDWKDVETTEGVTTLNNNNVGCEKKNNSEQRLSFEDISQLLGSNNLFILDSNHKKPFACNMKGCEKRYKNANGIKYHYKNYHNMLLPNFKKSIIKHKTIASCSNVKMDKEEFKRALLYTQNEVAYQTMPIVNEFYTRLPQM